MSGPFEGLFGPPPTPEEIAALEKKRAERMLAHAKRIEAGLPFLKEAQRALREAASFGVGGHRYDKASAHLAVLIEQAETDLVRNVT